MKRRTRPVRGSGTGMRTGDKPPNGAACAQPRRPGGRAKEGKTEVSTDESSTRATKQPVAAWNALTHLHPAGRSAAVRRRPREGPNTTYQVINGNITLTVQGHYGAILEQ